MLSLQIEFLNYSQGYFIQHVTRVLTSQQMPRNEKSKLHNV